MIDIWASGRSLHCDLCLGLGSGLAETLYMTVRTKREAGVQNAVFNFKSYDRIDL